MNTKELAKRYIVSAVEFCDRIGAYHRDSEYVLGGDSPLTGFDCSGLVHYFLSRLGAKFPGRPTAADLFRTMYSLDAPDPELGEFGWYLSASFLYDLKTVGRPLQSAVSAAVDDLWHVALHVGGNHVIEATTVKTQPGAYTHNDYQGIIDWLQGKGIAEGEYNVKSFTGYGDLAPWKEVMTTILLGVTGGNIDNLFTHQIAMDFDDLTGVPWISAKEATDMASITELEVLKKVWIDAGNPASGQINWGSWSDIQSMTLDQASCIYIPSEWVINLCKGLVMGPSGKYIPAKIPSMMPDNMVKRGVDMDYAYVNVPNPLNPFGFIGTVSFETLDGEAAVQVNEGIFSPLYRNPYVIFVEENRNVPRNMGDLRLSEGTVGDFGLLSLPTVVNMIAYYHLLQSATREDGKTEVSTGIIIRSRDDFNLRYSGYWKEDSSTFIGWADKYVTGATQVGVEQAHSSLKWRHQRFMSADTLKGLVTLMGDSANVESQAKYLPVRLV